MEQQFENGVLTITLLPRIDSSNADEVSRQFRELCDPYPDCKLILDACDLTYISSAGLRAILALRKKYAGMQVINASPEVYEIFEMTGFTEMIDIQKAYRSLSVEGCEIIGKGACGTVYRYTPDTIIKVYEPDYSLEGIHEERDLARKAFVMGVPTAIPYDVVRVGDRYGAVFELLNAKSFSKLIIEDPDHFDDYIGIYTGLLKKIHAIEVKPGDLPDLKEKSVRKIGRLAPYLPENVMAKLTQIAAAIPDSHRMLHGDYHIKNVMMQGDEVLLIDMDALCTGDPMLEFSFMYMTYISYSIIDRNNVLEFIGISYERAYELWEKTLIAYTGEDTAKRDLYLKNCPVIATALLMARFIHRGGLEDEYGSRLIEACKEELCRRLG